MNAIMSEKKRDHRKDDDDSEDRKSKKKRSSKQDDSASEDDLAGKRFGQPSLGVDDYFLKSSEFRVWLKEKQDVYFTELSGEEARKL